MSSRRTPIADLNNTHERRHGSRRNTEQRPPVTRREGDHVPRTSRQTSGSNHRVSHPVQPNNHQIVHTRGQELQQTSRRVSSKYSSAQSLNLSVETLAMNLRLSQSSRSVQPENRQIVPTQRQQMQQPSRRVSSSCSYGSRSTTRPLNQAVEVNLQVSRYHSHPRPQTSRIFHSATATTTTTTSSRSRTTTTTTTKEMMSYKYESR